jgi:hypothetical protein
LVGPVTVYPLCHEITVLTIPFPIIYCGGALSWCWNGANSEVLFHGQVVWRSNGQAIAVTSGNRRSPPIYTNGLLIPDHFPGRIRVNELVSKPIGSDYPDLDAVLLCSWRTTY